MQTRRETGEHRRQRVKDRLASQIQTEIDDPNDQIQRLTNSKPKSFTVGDR